VAGNKFDPLFQTLIASDLVDEYRMWVSPVVLGKRKRLFEKTVPPCGSPLSGHHHPVVGVYAQRDDPFRICR
jgi:hypothetical protein